MFDKLFLSIANEVLVKHHIQDYILGNRAKMTTGLVKKQTFQVYSILTNYNLLKTCSIESVCKNEKQIISEISGK